MSFLIISSRRAAHSRKGRVRLLVAPLLAGAILLAAAVSFAQSDAGNGGEPRFYGGAHLSFSNANVKAAEEYDPRFGMGGGVYVGGSVWKKFDLRVEANYVQKGANLTVGGWALEWQLDYLEVPVLLVYNLMPRSRTAVQFYGGVTYSIGLHQQAEEGSNLGYDLEDFVDESIPLQPGIVDVNGTPLPRSALVIDQVETTELGYMIGAGLSVPVGAVNLTFDARYTAAITDPSVSGEFQQVVGDGAEARVETTSADVTNKVWAWYVGFQFPFGARTASQ